MAGTNVSAALSEGEGTCFHCKEKATLVRKGWQLRSGEFAKLCDQCSFAYEKGMFCETFHQNVDGWRGCVSCGKMIHCGCVMSAHLFVTLDYGGMCCLDCGNKNITQAEIKYLCQTASQDFWNNFSQELANKSSPKLSKEVHFDKLMEGHSPRTLETEGGSRSSFYSVTPPEKAIRVRDKSLLSTVGVPVAPHSKLLNTGIERSEQASYRLENVGNSLNMRHAELSEVSGTSNSILISLFAKMLTVSDADLRTARLVIPKRYAEAFFPKASEQQRVPVIVEDMQGRDWKFHFHFWANGKGKSKMYVLEGLRDYMATMLWQPGDIVEFFRKEPEGKMVLATRKGFLSAVQPPLQERNGAFSSPE